MRNTSTVIVGLVSGGAGLVFGLLLFSGAAEDWQVMLVAAPLAAALTGALCWRLLVLRAREQSVRMGIVAGALTGLLSHPLAWYLAIVYHYANGAQSSLGEPTLNPVEGLGGSLLFSLGSWLLVGWITVPVGALAGWLLTHIVVHNRQA